jgi:D-alanine-D-alanine ligase-like ATP-grasp enzyme
VPVLVRLAARIVSRLDLLLATGPEAALAHRRLARRLSRQDPPPHAAINAAIWADAARELAAELTELEGGVLEIRDDNGSTRVWRHVTALDDPVTIRIALERPLVHRLLREADVPVPEHVECAATRPGPALRFVRDRGGPFVVKPASGSSGGHGVTCSVHDGPQALRAFVAAARFDRKLVVERQAAGDMYRLLLLDGELLSVVRRRPPWVSGDGRTSVVQLIAAENRRRLEAGGAGGLALLRPDLDCVLTLRAQGLSPRSVPARGTKVVVKVASSENAPHDNELVHAPPCQAIVGHARAAAAAVGLRLAGIDVVTTDLSRELRETGGAVIEVNGTPGLHYHYQVANTGGAGRVAVPILRRLLEESRPGP